MVRRDQHVGRCESGAPVWDEPCRGRRHNSSSAIRRPQRDTRGNPRATVVVSPALQARVTTTPGNKHKETTLRIVCVTNKKNRNTIVKLGLICHYASLWRSTATLTCVDAFLKMTLSQTVTRRESGGKCVEGIRAELENLGCECRHACYSACACFTNQCLRVFLSRCPGEGRVAAPGLWMVSGVGSKTTERVHIVHRKDTLRQAKSSDSISQREQAGEHKRPGWRGCPWRCASSGLPTQPQAWS